MCPVTWRNSSKEQKTKCLPQEMVVNHLHVKLSPELEIVTDSSRTKTTTRIIRRQTDLRVPTIGEKDTGSERFLFSKPACHIFALMTPNDNSQLGFDIRNSINKIYPATTLTDKTPHIADKNSCTNWTAHNQ